MISKKRMCSLYDLVARVNKGEADHDNVQYSVSLEIGLHHDNLRLFKIRLPREAATICYTTCKTMQGVTAHIYDHDLFSGQEALMKILQRRSPDINWY